MADPPFFSVVIPTYNRPQRLADCLRSFLALDYPRECWDLIVVNDGGEHSFDAINDDLKTQLPLRLMTVAHAGPATARNQGAMIAEGTYLAFTDDDCRVDPQWLRSFADEFARASYDALGGQLLNPSPDSIPAEAWTSYMRFLQDHLFRDPDGTLLLILSNNAAYRRDVFNCLGGFDERFPFAASEDTELGFRLVGNNYRQGYCDQAKVWHYHHSSYPSYIKQQFRYGRGDYYFSEILKNPDYEVPERKSYSLVQFYQSLFDFLRSHHLPKRVSVLFIVTPFVYRVGISYEWGRNVLVKEVIETFQKRNSAS
jgi:GT2 family glycosyltransferase